MIFSKKEINQKTYKNYCLSIINYRFTVNYSKMKWKNIKNWKLGPFFSGRLLFIAFIAITIFEAIDVITTEKKQLVFEVALKESEPQSDIMSQNANIVHGYMLKIDSPGWFYSFVLENNIGWSPLHSIIFLIVWTCGFWVTLKLDPNNFFSKDLSRPIAIAGLSLILFFFIERYTHRSFRTTVQEITHNQFKLVWLENSWMLWTGIGLAWLSKIMRSGYQLQKEQDLTV